MTRHILTKDTITANGSASRVIEESREHTGGEAAVEEGQASRPAVCATSVECAGEDDCRIRPAPRLGC